MIRGAVVLRPDPGSARTAARLGRHGVDVLRCPLFAIALEAWTVPDPAGFDALLLTSANAVRHAGAGLDAVSGLPVVAVGVATAAAAREAGLQVALTGDADAAAAVTAARKAGLARLLHLAGRDRVTLPGVEQITAYASEPVPVPSGAAWAWAHRVALLHSARAAQRFAALVDRDGVARATVAIAAISPAVSEAAGTGWGGHCVAATPTDEQLVAAACALIDRERHATDKQGG